MYQASKWVIIQSLVCLVAVCPALAGWDKESTIAESDIYEDPATTYEGVIPNIDPIDLRNYLVSLALDLASVPPWTRDWEILLIT